MTIKISLFKILLFIFASSFILSLSFANEIKKIKINGYERVSDETVIMFSNLNIGENLTSENLNNALKELYYTDYFKNVNISNNNGIVTINVIENPIIQSVKINGISKNRIIDKLEELTLKIEKYPFVENKINDQVNLIKNILKSNGYYFSDLKTSINRNDNNTVDLIYDIEFLLKICVRLRKNSKIRIPKREKAPEWCETAGNLIFC